MGVVLVVHENEGRLHHADRLLDVIDERFVQRQFCVAVAFPENLLHAHLARGFLRLSLASALRSTLVAAGKHEGVHVMSVVAVFHQGTGTPELDVVRVCANRQNVHLFPRLRRPVRRVGSPSRSGRS